MPRRSAGPRLWLRKGWRDGAYERPATWIIVDGKRQVGTGLGAPDRREAEQRLAAYIIAKHAAPRGERNLVEIPVADVLAIYLTDVAPGKANPAAIGKRAKRLLTFWQSKTLADVTGANCRAYAAQRGNAGGARRDLQDLAAAIGHHSKEGLHRGLVRVALPDRGEARQRWLTRKEAAALLRVCLHTREVQVGADTKKRPLRHLARFLLIGLYTGSRPGAILRAAWLPGPTVSFVDVDNGVFYRRPDGAVETNKRQPTVRLSPRLVAHLRRWKRIDAAEEPPRVYLVEYAGDPIASVKVGLGRAATLAHLPAGVTAYTLRHTCASWLVAKGLPTRLVADFLGTSEAMILQHYGHLSPDYQDRAAREIGRK